MRIIFLTIIDIEDIKERGIYQDLLRKFKESGHDIYIVSPIERKRNGKTRLFKKDGYHILKVWTFNIQKTNIIEKGLGTLLIEFQFLKAIKEYLSRQKFDLILYSTPPVTFNKVISYLKEKNNAFTYLLLKDIFPQNAVDLGMLDKKSFIYKLFRKKEKKLYELSDYIGCMSQANVDYILKNNPDISPRKIEINPNSISPIDIVKSDGEKNLIRKQFSIPEKSIVFIYGGNLGKPQGIDFLIQVLAKWNGIKDTFFLIIGNGTEFSKIDVWLKRNKPRNIVLKSTLPKNDYDNLIKSCDVGLIFLDKRFTIPNFPSRLLSYLENKLPVIAVTDENTDIGKILEEADAGYSASAGNLNSFSSAVQKFIHKPESIRIMGEKAQELLLNKYTVDISYKKIIEKENLSSKKNI